MSFFQKLKQSLPELGRFNARPAAMIDNAYLNEPTTMLRKIVSFIKIRAIYLLFFVPMSVVDLFVSLLLGLGYAVASFFSADNLQANLLKIQQKYATIFSKNFRVVCFSFFGLFSPKLIAFYFTPEKNSQQGIYAGGSYHVANNAELKHPKNEAELQQIITHASQTGRKVIPIGAGFSQGKQFLPEGANAIVVDLSKFNDITINVENKTAAVGAGVIWSDLQLEANKKKLALQVMQASNVFSVGGSIGTNIHGWDHLTGMLSNTILSMTIINAKGEQQHITPDNDLFHHITGGLGLFGIIIEVKIQLTDNILLKEQSSEIATKDYVRYFRDLVQHNNTTQMHLYRLSIDPKNLLGAGVAVSYDAVESATPMQTPHLSMEVHGGTRWDQILINLARRFAFIRKIYWDTESQRLLGNDSPEITRNEVMQPVINAMFNPSVSESEWLQEYFLPDAQLKPFLDKLSQLLMENDVVLLNASVRFVKQNDKAPFSYAQESDRFAVVLCWNQSLKESQLIRAKKWLRKSQSLVNEHGGTYYLPYQHVSSPEDFNRSYPRAHEAQILKQEVDPNQMFTSGFHQKYMVSQETTVNHFKAIMASQETKKAFKGFLEQVLQRVDSDKFYALLSDILEYSDTHAEIYQELSRRLPEITPSRLTGLYRILGSLSAIKHDLAEQAHAILPANLEHIDGLVEIGYPGRFVNGFAQYYKVTGQIVAVYESPSLTDYIQTGFPRPYHQFKALDYSEPNLTGLQDNSADIITCYVGLHHFPEHELRVFLKDIRRVLRDKGHFLLVEHDVIDDETLSMANMAHTIFNVTSGISLDEEMNETRNFQPVQYWTKILAEEDLGYAVEGPDIEMIREGDPSRNRMVSFVKTQPKLSEVAKIDSIVDAVPAATRPALAIIPPFSPSRLSHIGLFGDQQSPRREWTDTLYCSGPQHS